MLQSIPIFIPKNMPLNSAAVESYLSRLKDDTNEVKVIFGDKIGYLGDGAVFGVELNYDDNVLSVGSGCVTVNGYSRPIVPVEMEMELSSGEYVVFEDDSITKVSEPEGIILGMYDGVSFDYSVRSMNAPEDISTVEIVNTIDAASSSIADYIYVMSSGELYIKDDSVSDEMLSVVDRNEDMPVTPTKQGTNITSAKLKMSPGITAITRIESNSIIEAEGDFYVSIVINGNEIKRQNYSSDGDYINVYISSDCFVKEDATISVRLYTDAAATVIHSELYVG